MISFCTWIRDRLPQFRETLPENLRRTAGQSVEFVIFDDGSVDGLDSWMGDYLAKHPDPRVKYHRYESPRPIHFSACKNHAHRLANGDILVNLDCDNVVGPEYCRTLLATVSANRSREIVFHAWMGGATQVGWDSGSFGRIAMSSKLFEAIGGYDEALLPCGAEDVDLINRCQAYGAKVVVRTEPAIWGSAIKNDKAATMRHVGPARKWSVYNAANMKTSAANIAAGRLVANGGAR